MIRINFAEPDTSDWYEWRGRCEHEQGNHNAASAGGNPPRARQALYKGQKEAVYINHDGPFHGKCAYCEQLIYTDQYGDLEHYRPKAAVTEEDGTRVVVEIGGESREHPGYYWLCYDWRNLLPACVLCNRVSSQRGEGRVVGKGDRFPVRDFRAVQPGEETAEDPLLLHPVWDDPQEHLTVDKLGLLHPKTEKGGMCIRILGLNERGLPGERRQVYEDVGNLLGMLAVELQVHGVSSRASGMLSRLERIKTGRERFTAAALRALEDSRNKFLPFFDILGEAS